jgi:CheY-like chemotaxis protein
MNNRILWVGQNLNFDARSHAAFNAAEFGVPVDVVDTRVDAALDALHEHQYDVVIVNGLVAKGDVSVNSADYDYAGIACELMRRITSDPINTPVIATIDFALDAQQYIKAGAVIHNMRDNFDDLVDLARKYVGHN